MRDIQIAIAGLGSVMIFLGLVGEGDYQEAESQATNYCQMVELHKKTNGEDGWPDYKGTYEEACDA